MIEVARVVIALEAPDVAEEVMQFLDRTGRARVVGTAQDSAQLAEAVRQLEPDAVVAAPTLTPARGTLDGTALLALDTTQSVGALRRAIRAGASGFFLWPAERQELAVAATRIAPSAEETDAGRAPVIALYAPRGGAGATFVATHLAAAFARHGRRCVLIDLDWQFADVSAAIGVPTDDDPRTVADLVPLGDEIGREHVGEILWEHPAGFSALLAPLESPPNQRLGETYRAAIGAVRRTCDLVVLDVPRALDEVSAVGLDGADRVLVVLGLDVLSFRDAKRAIEAAGLEDRVEFIVNRAGRSEIAPRDVERVFGRPALAVIPSDRVVASARDHGRLIPMRGRVGRALDRLARRLEGGRESSGHIGGRSAPAPPAADRTGGCAAAGRDATRRTTGSGSRGGAVAPARAGAHAAAGRARRGRQRSFGCGRRDGAIEFLLKDPEVTEVMVNGPDDVYVERKGPLVPNT